MDYGPISVHDKMRALGLGPVPSIASLARIFREAGVARLEPKKRLRASWRRFVYPAPNACWQLDGTENAMTGGRKCVILQLIDDRSRLALASHVAWGETSGAPITVFDKAVAAHEVPQRLFSDTGRALNPSRIGVLDQLVVHGMALGVEPITGKPYKPTTQGKSERIHPVPQSRQTAARRDPRRVSGPRRRVRPHLQHRTPPPRTTWAPHSSAGLECHTQHRGTPSEPGTTDPASRPQPRPEPVPSDLPADTITKKTTSFGSFYLDKVHYRLGAHYGFKQILIVTHDDDITVTDVHGEIIAELTRPAPDVRYVGTGQRPGIRPKDPESSPKS